MKTHHAVGRWKMKVTDVGRLGRSFTGAVIWSNLKSELWVCKSILLRSSELTEESAAKLLRNDGCGFQGEGISLHSCGCHAHRPAMFVHLPESFGSAQFWPPESSTQGGYRTGENFSFFLSFVLYSHASSCHCCVILGLHSNHVSWYFDFSVHECFAKHHILHLLRVNLDDFLMNFCTYDKGIKLLGYAL